MKRQGDRKNNEIKRINYEKRIKIKKIMKINKKEKRQKRNILMTIILEEEINKYVIWKKFDELRKKNEIELKIKKEKREETRKQYELMEMEKNKQLVEVFYFNENWQADTDSEEDNNELFGYQRIPVKTRNESEIESEMIPVETRNESEMIPEETREANERIPVKIRKRKNVFQRMKKRFCKLIRSYCCCCSNINIDVYI